MSVIINGTSGITFPNGVTMAAGTSSPVTVAQGGTGSATLTANNVLLGNGTSALQAVAPGTNGNVLTSNGTTWTSAAAAAFDAGTRMMFAQTSAPTGWTKDTTNYNNHALRVVTGAASTGGSVDFTTAFAAGLSANSFTLTTNEMPSHSHYGYQADPACGTVYKVTANRAVNGGGQYGSPTLTTGGGGSHNHTLPSFAVKYLDVITATKN